MRFFKQVFSKADGVDFDFVFHQLQRYPKTLVYFLVCKLQKKLLGSFEYVLAARKFLQKDKITS